MDNMGKAVDLLFHNYEKFLMIGDFNPQKVDSSVKYSCEIYSFNRQVKESVCYRNPKNLKGI